ncbi:MULTISPECIES: hypothetical protein [Bacillales]|uniref:hypothetical protein n=1 Tax=Bacillales TaxID=1385 RepID=UPI000346FB6E|nr:MULTISPECIES: hypothetical protein [Bacillales]KMZ43991.1 hypothetical protein AC624_24495 [Bacillus sp. FJAT-27238]
MQSLRLVDDDLTFDERGELVWIKEEEEIAQCVQRVLSTNKGEWFLNPSFGIRFSVFFEKIPNWEMMREEIRQGIFQEPRVQTVESIEFQVDRKHRILFIQFVATTNTGVKIKREVNIHAG